MLSEKKIIVTIGDYGAIIALYSGSNVVHKILVDDLNDENTKQLKEIFVKNRSANVQILLDNAGQSYKRKAYPSVKRGDLKQIIERDMASDKDKENIRNFIISQGKKASKNGNQQWECLFVTALNSEDISKWISFILEMPNRTLGIYMLPIESFNMFKLLNKSMNLKSKTDDKLNGVNCIITQTKVGGLRQTVFSNGVIIFTRTLGYDLAEEESMEKYEHDLYSAFEYLKRLLPDLKITDFNIINILPAQYISNIEKINNAELNLVNLTPNRAALEIGYGKLLPPNSNYCDLLISKIFADSNKKILKFSTPKILFFEKFFVTLRFSYYLNLFLLMTFCGLIFLNIIGHNSSYESIELAEIRKLSYAQNLNKIKKISSEDSQNLEGDELVSIERIIDIGKNEDLFKGIEQNFNSLFDNLRFVKKFNLVLDKVSYSIPDINNKAISRNPPYEIRFSGKVANESGSVEDLFQKFDNLVIEVEKNMPLKQIKHSELPRNIDFNKKYYSLPVDFVVTSSR